MTIFRILGLLALAVFLPDPALATHVSEGPGVAEAVNPYGLSALWAQGDLVAKGTLVLLVLMSLISWFILVVRLWDQVKLAAFARTARERFWKADSVEAGTQALDGASPFRHIALKGSEAARHHEGSLTQKIDLHTWVTLSIQRAVDEVVGEMQAGLAVLATIGSTAPFVGLFGTVWGIYHALTAIGAAGQAAIDKVAGPVGEALIMTALGLAVAVPAVLGYNLLVRRNKLAADGVRAFASDLHAVLLAGRG